MLFLFATSEKEREREIERAIFIGTLLKETSTRMYYAKYLSSPFPHPLPCMPSLIIVTTSALYNHSYVRVMYIPPMMMLYTIRLKIRLD